MLEKSTLNFSLSIFMLECAKSFKEHLQLAVKNIAKHVLNIPTRCFCMYLIEKQGHIKDHHRHVWFIVCFPFIWLKNQFIGIEIYSGLNNCVFGWELIYFFYCYKDIGLFHNCKSFPPLLFNVLLSTTV